MCSAVASSYIACNSGSVRRTVLVREYRRVVDVWVGELRTASTYLGLVLPARIASCGNMSPSGSTGAFRSVGHCGMTWASTRGSDFAPLGEDPGNGNHLISCCFLTEMAI